MINASELIDEQEAYQQKMQAQVDQLEADFTKMRAKSEELQADAKIEASNKLEQAEQQLSKAKEQLANIKEVGSEAWEDFKSDLGQTLDNVRANLGGKENIIS